MSDQEAALAVERHHDQWHSDSMAECSNPACTLYRAFGRQATALAEARRALEDVEGKVLYCPPRKCLPCVAGLACEGAPTCDSRERNHAEALAIVRAALAAEPDGEPR